MPANGRWDLIRPLKDNDLDVSLKIPTVLISSLNHGLQRGI